MSWANYYAAELPAGATGRDALRVARSIVAACARPPIDLEARWQVSRAADLEAFAERVRGLEAPAERRVAVELFPVELPALIDIADACEDEAWWSIVGPEPTPETRMCVNLSRRAGPGEFVVEAEITAPFVAGEAVHRAVAERLDRCRARGLLATATPGAALVARFLADAAPADAIARLSGGVEVDGVWLRCRSWRAGSPAMLLATTDKPTKLGAADLAALWDEPGSFVRASLSGRGCMGTAVALARLVDEVAARDDGLYSTLSLEVRGEAELDAMIASAGDDPLVACWWCGFDGWGRAYHGVRLAIEGRYQDGNVHPEPGVIQVIVMVDAKRREPVADIVAAGLAARAGVALVRAGSGL